MSATMGTRREFAAAKEIALSMLTTEFVLPAYQTYLKERYAIDADRVIFDLAGAQQRLRDAVLFSAAETRERGDEIDGETDGVTIWIMRGLERDHMVEVLLHEAMHDSVFVSRPTRHGELRGLTCHDEHNVIYALL